MYSKSIALLAVLLLLFSFTACTPQKQAPDRSVETTDDTPIVVKDNDLQTETALPTDKIPATKNDDQLANRYALAYSFDRQHALMVTYGPDARAEEGDDDTLQLFYIMIPTTFTDKLYLRLFDPDCGDSLDFLHKRAPSTTRFSLYGGSGIFDETVALQDKLNSGDLIHQADFGSDPLADNTWQVFTTIDPSAGALVGNYRVFKLSVKGMNGAEGNVYNLAVSRNRAGNLPPQGLRIINYAPTLLLQPKDTAAELRFMAPEDVATLAVSSFDGAGATLSLETATRSLPLNSSNQGDDVTTNVDLLPDEQGDMASLLLLGNGKDAPNVVTFSISQPNGKRVAIELPVFAEPANNRPTIVLKHNRLADCRSIAFDAGGSTDQDNDLLKFYWDFGDGQLGDGARIVHSYADSGLFQGTLRVDDSSDQIGYGSTSGFSVEIEPLPEARAGADQVVAPGETVVIDGSGSTLPDGSRPLYVWRFGDGKKGEGAQVSHVYNRPGLYPVSLRINAPKGGPCSWAEDQLEIRVNARPVAEAGDDQLSAPNETLSFDSAGSYDPNGKIASFDWDLGDGNKVKGARVEHAFTRPGTYTVTLTVTDQAGVTNSTAVDTMTVFVNQPPVAVAGKDRRLAVGESSLFDGSGSSDADGYLAGYDWNFGDNETGRGMRIPYGYSAPGVYTVTLKVSDNTAEQAGVHDDSLTVIVNDPPVAHIKGEKLVTGTRVRFSGAESTDSDGKLIEYTWDFGDGKKGEGMEIIHPYAQPGVYTVTLTVRDDSGTRSDTASERMSVIVNQRPVADAGPDPLQVAPGDPLVFAGEESYDPDGGISAYQWTLDGETIGKGAETKHAFDQPGVYRLHLKIKDDADDERAVAYDEVLVRVNAPPTANAGPDLAAAPGDTVVFDGGSSFDPDGSLVKYQWKFNDGKVMGGSPRAERIFSAPGLYTAVLTVIDDSGAVNGMAQDEVSIFINHSPTAVAGQDRFTCDVVIEFDGAASVDPDGDVLTYAWDFGDGYQAQGRQVKHLYAEGGSYPVGLVVDDGHGLANSRHGTTMVVTINRPPTAVAGDTIQGCAGEPALFDGGRSMDRDGDLLSYAWDFGNGRGNDIVNPTTIYEQGGNYKAVLTVRDDSDLSCDTDVDAVTVLVDQSPTADAGPDRKVCANTPIQFDGSGSRDADGVVNAYIWNFGDSGRSEGPTPKHIFTTPGQYNVTLTVKGDETGSICDMTHTDEAIVMVRKAPEPRIITETVLGQGEASRFDGSTSVSEDAPIVGYKWEFGDGQTGEGAVLEHAFTGTGRYTVSLVITTDSQDECRQMRTEIPVLVNGQPVADGGADRLVSVNEPVAFSAADSMDNDGAITSYHWDFGDNNSATGINVRHRYRQPGDYTATLTVVDNTVATNNSDKATIKVTVNEPPVPRITAPSHACPNEAAVLSAAGSTDGDGSITGYEWTFGDGNVAEGSEVSHAYEQPGIYNLSLIVEDNSGVLNGRQQQSMILPVNWQPVARAGSDQLVCPNEDVLFDGSGSMDRDGKITAYSWDFKDGSSFKGARASHAFSKPGDYDVSLVVRDDTTTTCGVHEDRAMIRVNSPPKAVAGSDQQGWTGGAHDALFFDGSGSTDPDGDALALHWDFGDNTSATGEKVYHYFTAPGRYTVRLTVTDSSGLECGRVSDELEVEILER